jgi:hypothetical protein
MEFSMSESAELHVTQGMAVEPRLTRREMVQRLLAGAAVGAAWPFGIDGHPIHKHFANDAILAEADKLGAATWKPIVLNAEQNRELIALAESIVPGSEKALVNRFIDLLLSVDTTENRTKFEASLLAMNTEATKRFGKPFPILDATQREAVLTAASAEPASGDSAAAELHEHFENLKGWVSGAYYSSEAGMRELGWTGEFAFGKYPECEHAEGHV